MDRKFKNGKDRKIEKSRTVNCNILRTINLTWAQCIHKTTVCQSFAEHKLLLDLQRLLARQSSIKKCSTNQYDNAPTYKYIVTFYNGFGSRLQAKDIKRTLSWSRQGFTHSSL